MTPTRLLVPAALSALLCAAVAEAHDPSAWGGLFRSRDNGARWLPVNEGRFIGGALALSISPTDADHLLLGTDAGLLRSRNGGRDWTSEAPTVMVGAVLSAAFDADGVRALAATAQGVFRTEDGLAWQRSPLPREALPIRAILRGPATGRAYAAAANGVWRSDDWGASWSRDGDGLPEVTVTSAVVLAGPPETLWAVADRRLWRRTEPGRTWSLADVGMPESQVEVIAADVADLTRVWAAAADRIYLSRDGRGWEPFSAPFPEASTTVRGVAVDAGASTLVATTDRGLLRSADRGRSWVLQEGVLPVHLEAGPLVRDPSDPATLFAGFALTPYAEQWRMAAEGRSMLGRLDALSLAGGVAFLLVMALAAVATLRRLSRHYQRPAGSAAWPGVSRGAR